MSLPPSRLYTKRSLVVMQHAESVQTLLFTATVRGQVVSGNVSA